MAVRAAWTVCWGAFLSLEKPCVNSLDGGTTAGLPRVSVRALDLGSVFLATPPPEVIRQSGSTDVLGILDPSQTAAAFAAAARRILTLSGLADEARELTRPSQTKATGSSLVR